MNKRLSDAEAQAVDWAVRADAPDFSDWAALERWLAADPVNAVLFDRAASDAHAAAGTIASPPSREHRTPVRGNRAAITERRTIPARKYWVPLGIAAGLGGLAFSATWLLQPAPTRIVATRAGEVRTIMLDDHSSVTLNGGSEVRFASDQARALALSRGQASFQVHHDARHPFVVRAGAVEVIDLGTRFDIDRTDSGTVIAVGEGAVMIRAAGREVELHAGERSIVPEGGAPGGPSTLLPQDVSSWQRGTLTYDDVTVGRLLNDVNRRIGLRTRLSPGLTDRHFAGSVNLNGSPEAVIARLEAVIGIVAHRDNDGWTFAPRPDGIRR